MPQRYGGTRLRNLTIQCARVSKNMFYRKAETLIGLRTAAELPSLNRYATRYFVAGFSAAFLLPGAPFSVPEAFGTIGRPKKSTATCSQ